MKSLLHLLHLAGVIIWVGGMFFAHFCLRPVAAAQLQPPQRLPLLAAILGRFFAIVAVCIIVILLSGLTGIFGIIYFRHFPKLKAAVAIQDWPAAGAAMNSIRVLVAGNLALGATTILVAILGAIL